MTRISIKTSCVLLAALAGASTSTAFAQNTSQLAENGWYSDDTRADGEGFEAAGTNLVSDLLTDDPEATAVGTSAHNADITRQISFGEAPGTVPAGTHRGAVHLAIGANGSGKSQISHRKDDGTGFAAGSVAFGPATSMEYSWMGDGTSTVTASLKFGVKTADFVSTGVSGRTGENAWDKIMIFEPGQGNSVNSDGTWKTHTIDFTNGNWWFFDRTVGAATIGTPMTLADMQTSNVLVGGGPKTVADVYALITAPGAHVTAVQFGIGSGNAGGSVYVNQLETNFYRSGSTTTFGSTGLECDQDVTSNAIFGSGNINGSFTVDRNAGLELGMRGKLRFGAGNAPENTFNSNGDGTYSFETGCPTGGGLPGWASSTTPFWSVEWSVNTDYDGSSGDNIDALSYEMGMDFDPGPGTNYLVFDPIAAGSVVPFDTPEPHPFWDHSIGTNATPMGGGVEAGDVPTYVSLIANNNLAQNSWTPEFYNEAPFDTFDPTVPGRYEFYLAAFDGPTEVGRTAITIVVEHPEEYDQNVTNAVIFGSGNANAAFTTKRGNGLEIGMRAKQRFNVPAAIYNSNGDGTYTFDAVAATSGAGWITAATPIWNFEWSVNTDFDGSTGDNVDAYTYEIGIDFDPSAGTNWLTFDPITPGVVQPWWDHSFGTNATPDNGGAEAVDEPTYLGLYAANNLAQNSWNMEFFNDAPFNTFDPTVPGRYDFYVAALDDGVEVLRGEMTVIVTNGTSLTLEADACQMDADCNLPGVQIAVDLYQRNLGSDATGFQAFLAFDDSALTFEGAASSYSSAPYGTHIQGISTAEVAPGELRLDGNVGFGNPGVDGDARLATLIFTVANECTTVGVDFDLTQALASELSFQGSPIGTSLVDSGDIVADATPPLISAMTNITVPADAGVGGGCDSAVVTFSAPSAVDSCSSVTVECFPPSGTAFPAGETTTVTCVATDECGNTAIETFDVTVTNTNLMYVEIQLVGVTTATTRCIHFVAGNCTEVADDAIPFDGTGYYAGFVEVPCGAWSTLCAKDEQHTTWDNSPVALSMDGTYYVATEQFDLHGGDTDNDGDVDINDVTWFMYQFGNLAAPGGCAWDGVTRDSDFSNDGAVGSEDYTFLTNSWLSTSACSCFMPLVNGRPQDDPFGSLELDPGNDRTRMRRALSQKVSKPWHRRVDFDGNGRLDHEDVRLFEARHGVTGAQRLSTLLRDEAERERAGARRTR